MAQVKAWLELIGLPKDFRPEHVPGNDLEALARIQKYHLSAVPFENLERHYTEQHDVTLDLKSFIIGSLFGVMEVTACRVFVPEQP